MANGDVAMRLAVSAPAVGNISNTGGVEAWDRTLGFERPPVVLGWSPEGRTWLKICPKKIRSTKLGAYLFDKFPGWDLTEHYVGGISKLICLHNL